MESKRGAKWARGEKGKDVLANIRREDAEVGRKFAEAENYIQNAIKELDAVSSDKEKFDTLAGTYIATTTKNALLARAELRKAELSIGKGRDSPGNRETLIQKNINLKLAEYINRELQRRYDFTNNQNVRRSLSDRTNEYMQRKNDYRESVAADIIKIIQNKDNYLFEEAQSKVWSEARKIERKKNLDEIKAQTPEAGFLGDNNRVTPFTLEQEQVEEEKKQRENAILYGRPQARTKETKSSMPFRKFEKMEAEERDYTSDLESLQGRIKSYENVIANSSSLFKRRSVDSRIADIKKFINTANKKDGNFIAELSDKIAGYVRTIPDKTSKQKPADKVLLELQKEINTLQQPRPTLGNK